MTRNSGLADAERVLDEPGPKGGVDSSAWMTSSCGVLDPPGCGIGKLAMDVCRALVRRTAGPFALLEIQRGLLSYPLWSERGGAVIKMWTAPR